jgi:NCS2 family nucleobase:cation symporter-2
MTAGYALAAIYGVLTAAELQKVLATPIVSVPSFNHVGWSWDTSLALPFAIAALGACLKTVGCVTTCQKINDAEWVRPDLFSIERGVLADAAGTATAGLLGSLGINSSPTSVGVSGATGVTSRRVGFGVAAIFAALAFLPQAASILATMPRPVIGAALLFAASYVFMNGLQIISSRLLDARRTFVIGLSVMVALAVDLYPAYFAQLPEKLQPVLGSSLVLGIVCAVFLNMVFRLGARQTGRLAVDLHQRDPAKIEEFMETLGAGWGARREVIERARFNLIQSVETILDGCNPQGPVQIEASFDEFSLDIRVAYPGTPLVLPHTRPTTDDIIASDEGQQLLAGFLLRRLADRVSASHSGGRSTLLFHFDH